MKIDKYEEGSATSSCVEDVFYILKECLTRTVTTADMDCLTSMVNLVNQSLKDDYLALFRERLLTAFATAEIKDAKFGYMVCILIIQCLCNYFIEIYSNFLFISLDFIK
jgi:conserved oligomeric Golgi complex subunit 4